MPIAELPIPPNVPNWIDFEAMREVLAEHSNGFANHIDFIRAGVYAELWRKEWLKNKTASNSLAALNAETCAAAMMELAK